MPLHELVNAAKNLTNFTSAPDWLFFTFVILSVLAGLLNFLIIMIYLICGTTDLKRIGRLMRVLNEAVDSGEKTPPSFFIDLNRKMDQEKKS